MKRRCLEVGLLLLAVGFLVVAVFQYRWAKDPNDSPYYRIRAVRSENWPTFLRRVLAAARPHEEGTLLAHGEVDHAALKQAFVFLGETYDGLWQSWTLQLGVAVAMVCLQCIHLLYRCGWKREGCGYNPYTVLTWITAWSLVLLAAAWPGHEFYQARAEEVLQLPDLWSRYWTHTSCILQDESQPERDCLLHVGNHTSFPLFQFGLAMTHPPAALSILSILCIFSSSALFVAYFGMLGYHVWLPGYRAWTDRATDPQATTPLQTGPSGDDEEEARPSSTVVLVAAVPPTAAAPALSPIQKL